MKAIRITLANRNMLATRFNVTDPHEQLPIGYILVTDFGNDETFSVLTPAKFEEKCHKGTWIRNGWMSCSLKDTAE